MKLNPKSIFLVVAVFIATLTLSPLQKTEASSTSVEFIVSFSASMKETLGDKSKIEVAREMLRDILDGIREPLDAGLIFYGHRDNESCDDIEEVVPLHGLDREKMKKKLMKTNPKGQAPIALALKKAAEKLDAGVDFMSVVLVTDGKSSCPEDLVKTARELKEKYDYRLTFHIIALGPERKDRLQLRLLERIGYGTYHEITVAPQWRTRKLEIKGREQALKQIILKINNPDMHQSKVFDKDGTVLVPAGEFFMGTAAREDDPVAQPGHPVYLDSFYIDKYEVTQKQYKSVMGENPSIWLGSDLPVHNVSWHDARSYCEKVGKRLPTEAEWEKAAKGGKDNRWAGTSDPGDIGKYAWIDDARVSGEKRSGSRPRPIGEKEPNGYGIFDMSGNVWEWTADWYSPDYYKISAKTNPKGPDKGILRVRRGGPGIAMWRRSVQPTD